MEQFITTPSSSDVDFFIEKFSVEIGRSVDDNNIGTRTLTLTPSVKTETEVNNDIDKQITDLENLIKKLQGEIVEMMTNADNDKDVEEYTPIITEDQSNVYRDLSNETIILDSECDNANKTENVRDTMKTNKSKDALDPEHYSHVYPLTIHGVILPLGGGNKTLGNAITDILYSNTDETVPDKIVTQDVIHVWDDLPRYTPNKSLEVLIDELKIEISENMDTLKDMHTEPTDKFELA